MASVQSMPLPVALLLAIVAGGLATSAAVDHRRDLCEYLRKNLSYDRDLLPIINTSEPMRVALAFYPGHLMALDGAKQVMIMAGYFMMSWYEERLVWNASAFGGVNQVTRQADEIWQPRVLLYNGVGEVQKLPNESPVAVTSLSPTLSRVSYDTRLQVQVSCDVEMAKFPNDQQTCDVDLLIDSFAGTIEPRTMDEHNVTNYLAFYQRSNEWDLIELKQAIVTKRFRILNNAEPRTLSLHTTTLTLKRESQYYLMNMIVPLLLLTFLQVLVFFVPVESGEKMGLGITILLSFTVFLLLMDSIIPKSRVIPFIGTFITASMSLSAVSLLSSSLVLRLHFMDESVGMPRILRKLLIDGLARVMLVRRVGSKDSATEVKPFGDGEGVAAAQGHTGSHWRLAALAFDRAMLILGLFISLALIFSLVLPAVT